MSMKFALNAAAISIAALSASPAAAAISTFTGDISLTDPTFNRPLTTTSVSAVGTAVHYDALPFTVDISGSYALLMTSPSGLDTFLALYGPTFNPATPLANIIQVNDDFGGTISAGSGFTQTLTAGTSYVAILTAFANTGVGSYIFTITGPGTATPPGAAVVPEPATWALMMVGMGLVGASVRRRRVARATFG